MENTRHTGSTQSIGRYPPPPSHYKDFSKENVRNPPDLNLITKLGSFTTFGQEYKIKEINNFANPVELQILRQFDPTVIDKKNISNNLQFNDLQDPNSSLSKLNYDEVNYPIIPAIEEEIKFIKKTYLELLGQMRDSIDECELSSCLIKVAFQKIYFFIALLKKKKILSDMIKYFKSEIELNDTLENNLSNNMNKFQNVLQIGVQKIKEEMSNFK